MTAPARTLTAAEIFPTAAAPSLADAQIGLQEVHDQIDWGLGKIIRVTGSGTKVLTAVASDALGLDGNTLVIVESLSGTLTLELPYADDLCTAAGAGRAVTIKRRDTSANALNVARKSGDTIDGITLWTGFPMAADGDVVTLRPCENDTFAVVAAAIAPVKETVTATAASYAVPAGCRAIRFRAVEGAGGGSGGVDGTAAANNNGASGGGGAGAHSEFDLDVRTLATVAITIGAAGAAGAATAGDGGDGGTTSVTWSAGAHGISSGGGKGGKGVNAANGAVARGGAGGDPATTGTPTGLASGIVQRRGAPGGAGISMRDAGTVTVSGIGGTSTLGAGGRAETAAGTVGTAGEGYGAGAGGSVATVNNAANVAGALGTQGAVVLEKHFLRAP